MGKHYINMQFRLSRYNLDILDFIFPLRKKKTKPAKVECFSSIL